VVAVVVVLTPIQRLVVQVAVVVGVLGPSLVLLEQPTKDLLAVQVTAQVVAVEGQVLLVVVG
jgi:hypothetical protein